MTGSGTLGDPYIIYNVTDLQAMENDLTAYYELANDIDASATSGWNGGDGFVPIGQGAPFFTGSFNGKGHSITDLTINRNGTDSIGLFGITDEATIQNVTFVSPTIYGDDYVGVLVGLEQGTCEISNCSVLGGSVIGNKYVGGLIGYIIIGTHTISFCNVTCSVTSDAGAAGIHNDVGGLIGYARDIDAEGCYATGDVNGVGEHVGGLIGHFDTGSIKTSYSSGDVSTGDNGGDSVCGGFCGWSNGSSTNCYARGSVTATGNEVGGFAGSSGQETNCYSTGAVSGVGPDVGGFCGVANTVVNSFWDTETSGQATSDGGTGKTTTQMKTKSTFTDAGWDFAVVWGIKGTCNAGYPCLRGVTPCCTFTRSRAYIIS